MADGTFLVRDPLTQGKYPVKLVDNGDGTYSLQTGVAAVGGIGSLTETAPTTDTASSGLNGRLQRIAQRITSLITAQEGNLQPNSTQADQRLTVDATAGGVQFSAFHADTLYVYWTCEDAQARVTFDNSAPTSTNGHVINPGDSGLWSKALATAAKWIRTGTTSAVIHASQLK